MRWTFAIGLTLVVSTMNSFQSVSFGREPALLAGDHENEILLEVDPLSGHASVIGPLGFEITGLTYDSRHDILYGCSKSALYRIDPETAAPQPVGLFHGELMHTIEYDPLQNVLYGIQSEDTPWRLCVIDTDTGIASAVAAVSQNGLTGSAFDPTTGTMYVSNIYSQKLLTLDLTTGGLDVVGDFNAGIQVGTGMAYHPVYGILCADNRAGHFGENDDLYSVSKDTGAATLIGSLNRSGSVSALAYIPEPTTMFVMGLGGALIWRQKQQVRGRR